MSIQGEINRGYVDYLRVINAPPSSPAAPESLRQPAPESPRRPAPESPRRPAPAPSRLRRVWRGVMPAPVRDQVARVRRGVARLRRIASPTDNFVRAWRLVKAAGRLVRLCLFFAALCAASCTLLAFLKVGAWLRRGRLRQLHQDALSHVDKFVEQYPFHFDPIVLKCLQVAYLRRNLAEVAGPSTRVTEWAIGDGTLSSKVYPPGLRLVALDISPYSLKYSVKMPHVAQGIIADCLAPPLADGSFDLLVTNNFLNHVSDKDRMLGHMARIARKALFSEDTFYWASAKPLPFLLRGLGMRRLARRVAGRLAERFLQSLKTREEVDALVRKHYRIASTEGYFHEVTYFLCGLFDRLMGCYGPPTPPDLKAFFLNTPVFRAITLVLTTGLARALLRFDARQDPAGAVTVSYTCESLDAPPSAQGDLICPDCRTALQSPPHCPRCGRDFDCVDGMYFILPADFDFIRRQYLSETVAYEGVSAREHH